MALLLPPGERVLDRNGEPVSAGKVFVYLNRTSTLVDVWSDPALTVAQANPIELDGGGMMENNLYVSSGMYTIRWEYSDGAEVETRNDCFGWSDLSSLSYSSLAAVKSASLVDGVLITIEGRGLYKYDESSTATANDGTVILPDSGIGRILLDPSITPTVLTFGAIGNGVVDDRAAIVAAIASGGKTVIFPDGYTFELTTSSPIPIPTGTNIVVNGLIRATTEGDSSVFSIAAGVTDVSIVGPGRIDGPYAGTTPVPSGVYPAGNGAIRILGEYNNLCERIWIDRLEFRGWGDYGIFAENVKTGGVRECNLHKIGRDGVRSYGCEYFDVNNNKIHDISPGITGNVYGVTFTRRADNVSNPTVVNPPSRNCSANNNHVWDCAAWKGLDTHGGVDITFANNIIENCKIAIGVDEGDTSGQVDAPPKNITIVNNICKIGDVSTSEGGINVSSTSAASPGTNIKILGNTVEGFGGDNRGGIVINFTNDSDVKNNSIIDSAVSGIRIRTESKGLHFAGNTIKDLSGTTVAAFVSEDAETQAILESGVFRRTTGSYTGVSLATPTSGNGVSIGTDLFFVGTITKFVSGHESRIRGGAWVERSIASCYVTAAGSLSGNVGVLSSVKNSTGDYTIVLDEAASNDTRMFPVVNARTALPYKINASIIDESTIKVNAFDAADAAVDVDFNLVLFGY